MLHIGIDKPVVPLNAGFTHISTSWQVSKTKDFTGILFSESLEDTTNLLDYYVNRELEKDEVVFARAKVHFSDGSSGVWSRIITVSGNQKGFKLSNTIVVTPTLEVDSSIYDILNNGFEIKGSPFKLYAGIGTHKFTTWEITTILGDVVWSRKNDDENLTSIFIPKGKITDDKFYILKATYITDTNTSSNPGQLVISSNIKDIR